MFLAAHGAKSQATLELSTSEGRVAAQVPDQAGQVGGDALEGKVEPGVADGGPHEYPWHADLSRPTIRCRPGYTASMTGQQLIERLH